MSRLAIELNNVAGWLLPLVIGQCYAVTCWLPRQLPLAVWYWLALADIGWLVGYWLATPAVYATVTHATSLKNSRNLH